MCTSAPAALEKQRAPMAIVKERIAQRREASGRREETCEEREGCRAQAAVLGCTRGGTDPAEEKWEVLIGICWRGGGGEY